MNLLVFDIGGQGVKHAIWMDESLIHESYFKTPADWESLKEEMYQVFVDSNEKYSIGGVAISSPGSVDSELGIIKGISAVPYIHHFRIVDEWVALFKVPVTIENDANCAALAEIKYGVAKDAENIVFVVIGSGIGGSIAINRQLIKGQHLFAGEIGYMLSNRSETVSTLASSLLQIERHNAVYPNEMIKNGLELFTLAENGHVKAANIVEEIYDTLAQAIYNISVLIDPDLIVLGGGISVREEIVDELTQRVTDLLERQRASEIQPNIKVCQFYNDANLIGAAVKFQQTV